MTRIIRRSNPYAASAQQDSVVSGSEACNNSIIDDRYARLDQISWFRRDIVRNAKVLLVGVGALGNETLKNLGLFGIGRIAVCDYDDVELSNLSRSLLFTESDIGTNKAVAAAAAMRRINPHIQVLPLAINILGDVGTAFFGFFDVVIGAVDTREGRLEINRACWKMTRPFIDGGLDVLSGVVKVFVPPDSACYECTMTAQDRADLARSNSCRFVAQEAEATGSVPTTAVSASLIGALQAQELMKLLHPNLAGVRRLAGEAYDFNGVHFEPLMLKFLRQVRCASHETYVGIMAHPGSRKETTVGDLVAWAKRELDLECDNIRFDRAMLSALDCEICNYREAMSKPLKLLRGPGHCPSCGSQVRRAVMPIGVTPENAALNKTIAELGIPPMDILHLEGGRRNVPIMFAGDHREIFSSEFLQN